MVDRQALLSVVVLTMGSNLHQKSYSLTRSSLSIHYFLGRNSIVAAYCLLFLKWNLTLALRICFYLFGVFKINTKLCGLLIFPENTVWTLVVRIWDLQPLSVTVRIIYQHCFCRYNVFKLLQRVFNNGYWKGRVCGSVFPFNGVARYL